MNQTQMTCKDCKHYDSTRYNKFPFCGYCWKNPLKLRTHKFCLKNCTYFEEGELNIDSYFAWGRNKSKEETNAKSTNSD